MYSKLQYISQGSTTKEQLENIQNTLDAGCQWIQLRFKEASGKEFVSVAEQAKNICEKHSATFIINDNVELAKNIDADGVHLGLQDMPVAQARIILGGNKIIGGTANTIIDVLSRIDEQCDYIGLGPFRFTSTKTNLSPLLNLEGYENIMNQVLKNKIHIPIYAIGGITVDDVRPLIETGIYGVAVSAALTCYLNKNELIQKFNSLLYSGVLNNSPLKRGEGD